VTIAHMAIAIDYVPVFQDRGALRASRKAAVFKSLFFFVLALLISIGYSDQSFVGTFVVMYKDVESLRSCHDCCCVDGWEFLLSASRLIFAFGILSSMVAQARIESYLQRSSLSLYTRVNFKLDNLIESTVGWSSIFISIALLSLVFLQHPKIHIALSYLYVWMIFGIDLLYLLRSGDKDPNGLFFLKQPSFAIKKFAQDLIWKVDVVSIVPLTTLILVAGLLYSFGTNWFGTATPWEKVAEIFLSGAIGFHLFATWILMESLMADWNIFLLNSAKVYKNANGNLLDRNIAENYCIEHCLIRVVRTG